MEDINKNLFYLNFLFIYVMLVNELLYDIFIYLILCDNTYFMLWDESKQMASHLEFF